MTDSRGHSETATEIEHERLTRRLVALMSVVLILGVASYGVFILRGFNRSLEPELDRRASLIGATIRDDTERALGLGIPLTELVGVEDYLKVFLDEFSELDYLALRDQNGEILAATGGESLLTGADGPGETTKVSEQAIENADSVVHPFSLVSEGIAIGTVDVGVDRHFVRSKLNDLALDVMVILLVSLVVAYEVTLALGYRIVDRPSARPAGVTSAVASRRRISDVRIVLFVFVVAEELNKSFLPLFIKAADNPIPGLDASVAISLPIVAYLVTMAIASPFAGRLVITMGQRALFLVGLAPAALSHLGMMLAGNVVQIMALRALTGVGYALATIACMDQLIQGLAHGSRARNVGVFFAVVMGGTFAGTALGGIFADRLGEDTVFAISFFLVVTAGLFAAGLMPRGTGAEHERPHPFRVRDVGSVLSHRPLVLLLAGVTIPMNVLMAAFLWYLVPLTMAELGSGASATARTMMVYYLVVLFVGPVVGKIADRRVGSRTLVGVGSVMSAVVLLLPAITPSVLTISLAVLVVGIGHAAVRGPQVAMAMDIADAGVLTAGRDATLAAVRSLERIGSVIGLLGVAVLAATFELEFAIGVIGAVGVTSALTFVLMQTGAERRPANV